MARHPDALIFLEQRMLATITTCDCWIEHARAQSREEKPWTCSCECHNNKPEENSMDGQPRFESFDTEAEATAFTEGLDYADNDHISFEPPYEQEGKWVVEVTQFA